MPFRPSFLPVPLVLALALTLPGAASAAYPDKPIRLIVPFAAGGAVDAVARTVAARLTDTLKQRVVVENRAGASGTIGAEAVARSPADGYTLLLTASTVVVNPFIMKETPRFDTIKDLTHLNLVASGPLLFVAAPGVNATSAQDFVAKAKAKANPERFNFAVGGLGAAGHQRWSPSSTVPG